MKKLLFIPFVLVAFIATAQLSFLASNSSIPPSAFNDISGWWRADTFTGSSGSYSLTDKSAFGHPMGQTAGTMTAGTASNGQAKFTCSSAILTSNLSLRSWPCTIITVGKRTSGAQVGFFGHQGSTPYNTLWYGYEASDSYRIYAVNSTTNTTTEAGSDAAYMARIGYGSRVPFINGIIQADMTKAIIPRTTASNTSLGTEYRSLNMDWYETLVWDRLLSLAEIDEVNAYINARYGMSIPLWSSYTLVKQINFSGQSNSDGRGDRGTSDVNIPVAYRSSLSTVFDWDGSSSFPNMNLSTNTVFNPLYIGQELTAAKDYTDRLSGENIYVFKNALGSTSMSYTASGNSGYWTNLHDATAMNDSRSEYSNACTQFWTSMRVHQSNSRKPDMKGFIFYQGEDDATDATMAANWSSVAQDFFTAIRYEYGYPTTKVYLIRIHHLIDLVQQPYRDTVRAQQDACSAVLSNCQEVSVDSYNLRDGAHIDVNGQIALGQFLATQF